jgi:hypothetical protein
MMRLATTLAVLALITTAPSASAQGFREPEVRAALEANGLAALADTLAPAARPALILDRTLLKAEPSELGTTRLGGRPDLPVGTKWPRCRGYAQTFLAQLRPADLPAEAAELNGHDGTLLFFAHIDRVDGGWNQPFSGECATVVHARTGAPLRRARVPRHALRLSTAVPRFDVRPDLPAISFGSSDRLMAPLHAVKVEDSFAFERVREQLEGERLRPHRLLGHSDPPVGGSPCSLRAERPVEPWRHLFTLGYDKPLGFAIAHFGRAQFLISPADLQAGRFTRACGFFTRY